MKNVLSRALALAALLPLSVLAQPQPQAQPKPTPQQPMTKEVQALPSFAALVESVKPAVVNVEVQARMRGGPFGPGGEGDELWERFFGGQGGHRPQEEIRPGAGSGFVIDPAGIIVTNNHVVEDAVSIRVTLDDGRQFPAEVVGRDPLTDVAVIRVSGGKASNLPSVKLGDSDALKVGDWVMAIGNPFGLASSVSAGIVSAVARNVQITSYDEFIQTDAAINPGNSGGPLFNLKGEVVGMNTAIVGSGTGIGFAVPSSMIRALLPQLQKAGKVTRGYLGVQIQDLNQNLAQALGVPQSKGAIVTEVTGDSPSAKSLKQDDVVVAVNGQKVESAHALSRMVALMAPGSKVTLKLYRQGKPRDVPLALGTRPDIEGVFKKEQEPAPQAQRQQKIGISFTDMDPRYAQGTGLPNTGALIQEVRPGSPAETAQLQPGMVVVEAGGKPVKSAVDLERAIKSAKPGSLLLLRVQDQYGKALRALPIP